MPWETLLSMTSFAFVSAFTPGPNNIMLTASGVNFGFARTLPHIAGVSIGFLVLLSASGLGLGALFTAWPPAQTVLKVLGAAYMLWLAWKIANAAGGAAADAAARPFGFWQAAAFQWVNVKGVIIALGAVAIYVRPTAPVADLAWMLTVFGVMTAGSATTWTAFGAGLSRLLRQPGRAVLFNRVMAVLLVLSIIPMVWDGAH